jgi:4-amino-4-deoxy-L-arabinose transferase-like glycosyltransferase
MTTILTAGLVVVAALLAHEAWPRRTYAPALAAAATALLPAVLRIGHFFHPDPLFALLSVTALLLVVRAKRLGWTVERGIAVGAVLGGTALVRQSAPIVFVALVVTVIVLGRRQALLFGMVALLAAMVVAGPWWGYQTSRFGNPIESNLDRPGYMLDRQPRSFFISLPVPDLVTRPYRESFKNQLLPRFHADLWSDWLGSEHSWASPSRADRVVATSQSVLGLGGDLLVLGGLAAFGFPALRRSIRTTAVGTADSVLAASTLLFVLGWAAYVVTLVRFPQADGDPIQAHYLLFLGPVAALFAVCSARWAWNRSAGTRALLVAWLALFLASFVALLVTTYG